MIQNNKMLIVLVGVLIVTGLLGTWAYTKAEGSSITICAQQNGTMYVVGAGFKKEDCKSNGQLLSWNVQGPAGPAGPQGPQGEPGAGGADGALGPQGLAGLMGPAGSQGQQGLIGPQGATGSQGAQGIQGPAGAGITRANVYKVVATINNILPGQNVGPLAECEDTNDVILSGGYEATSVSMIVYRSEMFPFFARQAWTATMHNGGAIPVSFSVFAWCLRV